MARRKFCKTLCKLIEKKGKVPCVEDNCKGYIYKVDSGEEESCSEFLEFLDYYDLYQCDKNKHTWKATYNDLTKEPIFEKLG